MEQRPKPVLIVAGFLFAASSIAVIVGISLLYPNRLLNRLWELNPSGADAFRSLGIVSGVLLLILGAATFAAARDLLRGKRWAWWFAVALFAVNGCGSVVN